MHVHIELINLNFENAPDAGFVDYIADQREGTPRKGGTGIDSAPSGFPLPAVLETSIKLGATV